MSVNVNINGIDELDFPSGVTSATVTNGKATINFSNPARMVVTAFMADLSIPLGNILAFTLDIPIVITEFTLQAGSNSSGSTTNAQVIVTVAGVSVTSITVVDGTSAYDNSGLSINVPAGSTVRFRLATASAGTTPAKNVMIAMQYKMG
jgi:hypothetical protein